MAEASAPIIVGWQEWLALPELGLPAIKAKIDTGARTSALHAFQIEPFGPAAAPMVRFGVHPVPGRLDIAIFCSASIVDRREVISSNGERETRAFIRTVVALGGSSWPIEIGLTNRESMTYRMLLGRQAIRDDMMVDPTSSFRQPRLSYRLYRHLPREEPVRRALRIALVTSTPALPSNHRLAAAAQARGHVLEMLDLGRLTLAHDGEQPRLSLAGEPLAHYDAVITRIGIEDGRLGGAAVRQLEMMGAVALNSGDALDLRANRLATVQALDRARVAHVLPMESGTPPPMPPTHLRVLVIGDKAVAAIRYSLGKVRDAGVNRRRPSRRLAERAASALALGLAAVDIEAGGERRRVLRISARPALGRFERVTGIDLAAEIIAVIEARAGTAVHREAGD